MKLFQYFKFRKQKRRKQSGIISAEFVYVIFAVIIYFVGVEKTNYLFPSDVTVTIIVVIRIGLSFSGMNDMSVLLDLSD